jgi:hypothetical protein
VISVLLAGIVVALLKRRVIVAALLSTGLMWAVLIGKTGFPVVASSMRYAVFLLPALALLVGLVARRVSVVAVGAMAYASVVVLGSLLHLAPYDPRRSGRIAEVATFLRAQDRTHIWSTYWIAYVVAAETQERVTAASVEDDRYEPYRTAADRAPTTVLVRAGGPNDRVLETVAGGHRTIFGALALWTWPEHITLPPLGND